MSLLAAAAGEPSALSSYGPILIATAGLITALVAALSRRDKKQTDFTSNLDARTKTALAGIQAYADRAEAERARCQEHAEQETARADAAETRVEELEAEVASLRAQLAPKPRPRPGRSRPGDSSRGTS